MSIIISMCIYISILISISTYIYVNYQFYQSDNTQYNREYYQKCILFSLFHALFDTFPAIFMQE